MIEKIIRGLINIIRISILHIRLGSKIEMPYIQPMRIKSQLMIQNGVLKVKIGSHFKLETDAKIRVIDGGTLSIGDNCFINCNSYITAMGKTTIGNNCLIGPGVMIFDHDHEYRNPNGILEGSVEKGEIFIGNNVWIGANSVILKGAHINDGSVVAAGSVVNKEIPKRTLFVQKRNSGSISI